MTATAVSNELCRCGHARRDHVNDELEGRLRCLVVACGCLRFVSRLQGGLL